MYVIKKNKLMTIFITLEIFLRLLTKITSLNYKHCVIQKPSENL